MKKKLNNKGETLVETLVALLIITIVIAGFAEIISKLASTNKIIKENRTYYTAPASSNCSDMEITITVAGQSAKNTYTSELKRYQSNGLYSYEY